MRTNQTIVKTKFKQNVGTTDYNSKNKCEITLTIKSNNSAIKEDDIIRHMSNLNISNFTIERED